MAGAALLALGLALVAEGLVWALAPRLVEAMLVALHALSLPERRIAGLAALGVGTLLLWAGFALGARLTPT